jgi:hypothetical protein
VPFIEKVGRGAWFNPGVIGMPANDGTPDVWYGLIGLEVGHILLSTRRLAYDHHGAAAAMRRSGHADGYARALVTGVWPSLDVFPPTERAATGQKLRQRTRADSRLHRVGDDRGAERLKGLRVFYLHPRKTTVMRLTDRSNRTVQAARYFRRPMR